MSKETELTPEQKEGIKQYEAERSARIKRVLDKEAAKKQADIELRQSKKRGTKKA